MIPIPSSLAPFFASPSGTALYTVRVYKSEGGVDPDGGADDWPGTGLATVYRIFTSSRPAWGNVATLISEGSLYVDRVNRDCLRAVVFKVGGDRKSGGLAAKASFSFEVDNSDGLFRTFEDGGVRFEGRRVYVLLGSVDDTTDYGANDLIVFTGRITEIKGTARDRVLIEAEGCDDSLDREIPAGVFSNEGAAYEDDYLPTYTKGRPIPLCFGDHDQAEGFTVSDTHDTGTADGGKVVQFVDPAVGNGVFALAAGKWGDRGLIASGDGFADVVNATVAGVGDLSIWTAAADGASIKFRDFDDYLNLWIPVRLHSWARNLATPQTGVHDERNAIDDAATTKAHFDATPSGNTSWIAVYKVPKIEASGNVIFDADPDPFIYATLSATADASLAYIDSANYRALIVQVQRTKNALPTATGNYLRRFYGTSFSYPRGTRGAANRLDDFLSTRPTRSDFESLSGAVSDLWLMVGIMTTGSPGATPPADVFDVGLELLAHIDWPDEGFFARLQGHKDFSPAVYSAAAGAMLENPAHVLAFLWGECSAGSSADVDLAGHRAVASGARSGWKVAKQLLDADDLSSYVASLAEQTFLWSWFDENGKARVFPMQAVTAGSTSMTLRPTDVDKGELDDFDLTPIDEVVTSFVVRYHDNPVSGAFDGEIICNESEASAELGASYVSLCAWARYNNGGKSVKRVFELDWIRDRTTAVEIAKKLVAFHGARRYIISMTGDVLRLGVLQLGDSLDFDVAGQAWPASYPRAMLAGQYRVVEKRLTPESDLASIKAAQVFE